MHTVSFDARQIGQRVVDIFRSKNDQIRHVQIQGSSWFCARIQVAWKDVVAALLSNRIAFVRCEVRSTRSRFCRSIDAASFTRQAANF
jgi:hypothetical protein